MSEAPTIQVNEERLPWVSGEHIAALLGRIGTEPDQVATALNGEFVPRARRVDTLVRPGDVLTIFKAIVGG